MYVLVLAQEQLHHIYIQTSLGNIRAGQSQGKRTFVLEYVV